MGRPSKGTPKDMRLKENKPGAKPSAPTTKQPAKPFVGAAKPFTKKGGK